MRLRLHVRWFIVLALLAAGFSLAPVARGATCSVPSTAYPTINSATGDANCTVIKLGAKTFYENVTVPNPNVTIVGAGGECAEKPQSIIDAAPGGVNATGTHVQADNVTVKNLVIRHGTAGIDTDFDNTKVINTCIFGARGGGEATSVSTEGANTIVKNSEFHSSDGPGLRVEYAQGTSATFTGNFVHNVGDHCVHVARGSATVSDNRLRSCDDQGVRSHSGADLVIENNIINNVDRGVEHTGEGDATVRRNTVTNAQDKGLQVSGNGTRLVTKNTVVSSRNRCIEAHDDGPIEVSHNLCQQSGGISVEADTNPKVLYNQLEQWSESEGIKIRCDLECEDAEIIGNTVANGNRDHQGIRVEANDVGGLVQGNTVTEAGGSGFQFQDVDGWTIQSNQAIRNGQREGGDHVGFKFYDSSDNQVLNNIATGNKDDGFAFQEDSNANMVSGNTASKNVKDGFHVRQPEGDANIFDTNTAKANSAEGFENDGTGTTFTNNIAKKNRTDCVGADGTELSTAGTTCGDGSDFDAIPPNGTVD